MYELIKARTSYQTVIISSHGMIIFLFVQFSSCYPFVSKKLIIERRKREVASR